MIRSLEDLVSGQSFATAWDPQPFHPDGDGKAVQTLQTSLLVPTRAGAGQAG